MSEIILCVVLLLFALDVRFDIFKGWKPAILKATGLVIRVVVFLLSAVILFFCGKVMISSDYHMDRAVRNATKSGFSRVMRLPAPSGFFTYGANVLSEVILDLNDLIK